MTFAHLQRGDGEGRQVLGQRQVLLLKPALPLNAANDNEQNLRLANTMDGFDLVTSAQSKATSSFGTMALIIIAVSVLVAAVAWIVIISATLLDGARWVLS